MKSPTETTGSAHTAIPKRKLLPQPRRGRRILPKDELTTRLSTSSALSSTGFASFSETPNTLSPVGNIRTSSGGRSEGTYGLAICGATSLAGASVDSDLLSSRNTDLAVRCRTSGGSLFRWALAEWADYEEAELMVQIAPGGLISGVARTITVTFGNTVKTHQRPGDTVIFEVPKSQPEDAQTRVLHVEVISVLRQSLGKGSIPLGLLMDKASFSFGADLTIAVECKKKEKFVGKVVLIVGALMNFQSHIAAHYAEARPWPTLEAVNAYLEEAEKQHLFRSGNRTRLLFSFMAELVAARSMTLLKGDPLNIGERWLRISLLRHFKQNILGGFAARISHKSDKVDSVVTYLSDLIKLTSALNADGCPHGSKRSSLQSHTSPMPRRACSPTGTLGSRLEVVPDDILSLPALSPQFSQAHLRRGLYPKTMANEIDRYGSGALGVTEADVNIGIHNLAMREMLATDIYSRRVEKKAQEYADKAYDEWDTDALLGAKRLFKENWRYVESEFRDFAENASLNYRMLVGKQVSNEEAIRGELKYCAQGTLDAFLAKIQWLGSTDELPVVSKLAMMLETLVMLSGSQRKMADDNVRETLSRLALELSSHEDFASPIPDNMLRHATILRDQTLISRILRAGAKPESVLHLPLAFDVTGESEDFMRYFGGHYEASVDGFIFEREEWSTQCFLRCPKPNEWVFSCEVHDDEVHGSGFHPGIVSCWSWKSTQSSMHLEVKIAEADFESALALALRFHHESHGRL
eukprot:GEMP01012170.1.p1 GENE.GEMP01012170.1~~GEMP01012170.1.p1  ORF type:complete len:752 (+),score=145.19 GEMP01012170.1:372-2627(+)